MKSFLIRLICCFVPSKRIRHKIRDLNKRKPISVIIPCYNVSQYIARCLESLMRQTLPNLEFLFVDDASTDNTADIIKSYANQDSRIKLIRLQKNHGPGYARNVGFKNATGEYVSFIDPDDYLDYDFYDVLYNVAKKYNIPDVVKAKLYIDNDAAGSQLNTMINNNHLYFCKEHTTAIYKRDFLLKNNIFYPEDILTGQDACFVSNIVLHTNNIKTTDNTCYHYVRHNGSMDSNELSHDKVLSRLKMLDYKVDLLNKNIFNNDADKQIFIVEHIKNHFIYLYNADKQEQKSQPLIEKWKQNHLDIFNE